MKYHITIYRNKFNEELYIIFLNDKDQCHVSYITDALNKRYKDKTTWASDGVMSICRFTLRYVYTSDTLDTFIAQYLNINEIEIEIILEMYK